MTLSCETTKAAGVAHFQRQVVPHPSEPAVVVEDKCLKDGLIS
jgi:hypothetical protein